MSPPFKFESPIKHATTGAELSEWAANSVLLAFFHWLGTPFDVDGDGRTCLVDAYKFAGLEAGKLLRGYKAELTGTMDEWLGPMKRKLMDPSLTDLERGALVTWIERRLDLLHLHQEPWMLNPRFGKRIVF